MKLALRASLVIIFTFMLTSCATDIVSSGERTSTSIDSEKEIEKGTAGALVSISSSNVSAAGYDISSRVMTVRFSSGAVYEYYDVPLNLWEDFLAAQPNPWSEVGNPRLVKGGFAYKRIG